MVFAITLFSNSQNFAAPPVYMNDLNDALALSESSKTDLLVIFSADWCYHCKRLKEDIQKQESVLDDYIVCFVDKDKNPELVKEYRVRSIPDYMLLRNKVEIKRKAGYDNISKLERWLNRAKK